MFFKPTPVSREMFEGEVLEDDLKGSFRCGNVSLGKRALYFGTPSRRNKFYIPYSSISRIEGVIDGKDRQLEVTYDEGIVRSIAMDEKEECDIALSYVASCFPEIKTLSERDEKLYLKLRHEWDRKALRRLEDGASECESELKRERAYMEENPLIFSLRVSLASLLNKKERMRYLYFLVFAIGIVLSAISFTSLISAYSGNDVLTLLIGLVLVYLSLSYTVLPSRNNRRRELRRAYAETVSEIRGYISKYDGEFLIPERYAHPVLASFLIALIREGKACDAKEALEIFAFSLDEDDGNEFSSKVKEYFRPLFGGK